MTDFEKQMISALLMVVATLLGVMLISGALITWAMDWDWTYKGLITRGAPIASVVFFIGLFKIGR